MYSPQNYVEKPLNLLTFDSLGHAILNRQTLQLIQSIPKPISILAIAGPYRTGKSYLLNSLVAGSGCNLGQSQKFQVSSTTRSCTKGLWVWGKPLTSVDQNGKITNVLIIDTQGFGSVHQVHDKRIIILALLLSTCFVYNSKGLIDGDSIKDLQYVIEETKKVKRQLCFDSVTDFHWILRDFHYQLVNQLGFQISSDQYMQNSLKQYCDSDPQNNELFTLLCNFFRNRSCHTFLTPQTNPSQQQNPQFTNQLLKFKKIILNRIPSLNLDGAVLGQIIQAYVSAMNQNYTENGVYREGAECRLRITCLSQLCKELQHILLQETPEKRVKMIKMALNDVQDSFIAKMTSQKQIKILKQEVNMLISEFESVSAPTTSKNIKIREGRQPRQSTSLPKIRQPRSSTQPNQFGSELQIRNSRNSSRIQMAAIQKIRQQLQSKIHRYELQLTEHNLQLAQLKTTNNQLLLTNNKLQQNILQITNISMLKQREHTLHIMEIQQKMQQMRKQYNQNYSSLQKNNQLLLEKQEYLQAKIAQIQIINMERQSALAKRYKQRIKQLEKQLQDMRVKHQIQIQQVKQIYRCKDIPHQQQQNKHEYNNNSYNIEALKQYTDRIFLLQQQISQLTIDKMQIQHKLQSAQSKIQSIKSAALIQNELASKKYKQKQCALIQLHSVQLQAKQKLITDIQIKQQQQRVSYQQQIQAINKKNQQIVLNLQNLLKDNQQEIKKLQDQCVQACQRYQIQCALRTEKQKEVQKLIQEIQYQRGLQSRNYDSSFQNQKLLRQQLLSSKKQVMNLSQLLQTSQKCEQQLHTQLNSQKQAHKSHIQQLKNFHHLQTVRLQNKISALVNSNSHLKQINKQIEDLQSQILQLSEQKQQKIKQLQYKNEHITNLQRQQQLLRTQNNKLSRLAQQLTGIIKNHNKELQELADKNNNKLQQKQGKIMEMISKIHEKQKQCYILNERLQSSRKQLQTSQKQSQKQISDKIQQKNSQILKLSKNLQSSQLSLLSSQAQLNKISQKYSLLQQRYQHLDQMLQSQVTDVKQRANREIQRINAVVIQLQEQIKRISQEKIQAQKMIRIYQNDQRETVNVIADIKRKYQKNVDSYQTNIKLMRKKSIELDLQNRQLKDKLAKIQKKLQCIQISKQILQQNYNEDFKLWCNKFEVLEKQRQVKRSLSNCQLTSN